jgi:phage gpG-like protein
MAGGVEIKDGGVMRQFERLISLERDRVPWFTKVGALVVANTKLRLAAGISPDGKPFAPVKRGGQPLLDKGVHIRGPLNYQVDNEGVTVGIPFGVIGAVHQFGATIKAKVAAYLRFQINGRWSSKKQVVIPARPWLGISQADRVGIVEIMKRQAGLS